MDSYFINRLLENVAALLQLQSYILILRGYVFLTVGRYISFYPAFRPKEKGERGEMKYNACWDCVRSRHGTVSTELHRPTVGLHVGFWEFKIKTYELRKNYFRG